MVQVREEKERTGLRAQGTGHRAQGTGFRERHKALDAWC